MQGTGTVPKAQISKPQTKAQIPETPTSTPTPAPVTDPTANWKTYRSEEYGFGIKYPQTFEVSEISTENTPLLSEISILDTKVIEESGSEPRSPLYRYSFRVSLRPVQEGSIEDIYKDPLTQYLGQQESSFGFVETIN